MSQQISSRPSPGTKQRIAQSASSLPSACSFQSGISSPILQPQRTLGNQRVAQLIRARRLTPQGGIIGLQRKLTVGAADDQYEQEADRVNGNPDAGYRTTASGNIGLHLGGKGCATSKTYEVKDDVPDDPKAQFHLHPVP